MRPLKTVRSIAFAAFGSVLSACGPDPADPTDTRWVVGEFFYAPGCDGIGCNAMTVYNYSIYEDGTIAETQDRCSLLDTSEARWRATNEAGVVRLLPAEGEAEMNLFSVSPQDGELVRGASCDTLDFWIDWGSDGVAGVLTRGRACLSVGEQCIDNAIEWCDGEPEPCEEF